MTLPYLSPMQPEDLDEIMPLERLAFADPWSRRMYLSDLHENPLATYRVIRSAEGNGLPPILGWGGFWLLVDEAHIATVAAHPEYRGCGLGELLVVDLMERAAERGARVATLEVRASNLVGFHHKRGEVPAPRTIGTQAGGGGRVPGLSRPPDRR
jgi:[ribosomal protein S18]-alanine N-acetyltransferase